MLARFVVAVIAMAVTVTASNYLVQFPIHGTLFGIGLDQMLTWGAFTYPVAFLVNDLTNRYFGPSRTRQVVLVGFVIALVWSAAVSSPRIALASAVAYLLGQFLDISIFNRLRTSDKWWRAPLISSVLGAILDSVIFWGVGFAAAFAFVDALFGSEDGSLGFMVPFWDIGPQVPLWVSLALGDFVVKIAMTGVLLAPYKVLRGLITDRISGRPAAA